MLDEFRRQYAWQIREFFFTVKLLRRNPSAVIGFVIITVMVAMAVTAPVLAPFNPIQISLSERLSPPGGTHWFGTDELGRDILTRVMYGARISLWIGVVVVGIAGGLGAVVDATTQAQVEQVLKHASIDIVAAQRDDKSLKVRFRDTDSQFKARDTVQRALGDNYTVALNLLPATPAWFGWINANPMYLGLDLRGGVHFLMLVDMVSALKKAEERYVDDLRSALRDERRCAI